MEIINFKVEHQCIVADRQSFVSDTIGSYTCHFDFDEQWEGLNKVAVFVKGQTAVQIVLNENNECPFADELLDTTGNICIGVYGTKEGVRYPTVKTKVLVIHEGIVDGTQPTPPTEEIWEQLLNMIVAETERATSKEDDLSNEIASEGQRAINAEEALEEGLNEEISRAKAREDEIEDKIPSITHLATRVELQAETNARINADNEFTEDLNDVHNLIDDLEDSKAEKNNTYTKSEVNQLIAQATPSDYDEVKNQVETNKTNIESINELIPAQASEENQLADKEFVNSSIATNTATFIGTFNSVEELEAYEGTKTNNDYAFVIINDETTGFVKEYDRYKWNGTQWLFEYSLNNSSFTAQQWETINSGLTSQDVEDLHNALVTIEQIQTELANKMERIVLYLSQVNNVWTLKNEQGETLTFQELYNHCRNQAHYVVVLVGNSKLRPQYVSISEIHCDGEDRDSQGSLFMRMIMTPTNLYYQTFRQAEVSDLVGKANINLDNLNDSGKQAIKDIIFGVKYRLVKEGLIDNDIVLTDEEKLKIETWLGLSENYLTYYNETPYQVNGDYNPAHKKYVDTKFEDYYTKTEVDTSQAKQDTIIDRTKRSLDYLWKKSKGIIYDEESVESMSNEVVVPSGAMDYASLDMLGGMSRKGKNLLSFDSVPDATSNGITFTKIIENGKLLKINAKGTSTGVATFVVYKEFQAGTYYANDFLPSSGATEYTIEIKKNSQSGSYVASLRGDEVSFTLTETTLLCVYLRVASGLTIDVDFYPIITTESGVPYESYSDQLLDAKVDEINIKGKNLLNLNTCIPNAYINYIGVETSTSNMIATDYIEISPNTNYCYSAYSNIGSRLPYVGSIYDGEKNFISTITIGSTGIGARPTTFLTPNNAKYVRLHFVTNSSYFEGKQQLEVGSNSTTSVPYKQPITKPIPQAVQSLPSYGKGISQDVYNYQYFSQGETHFDELTQQEVNGKKWYKQEMGEVDLSTLVWARNATNTSGVYRMRTASLREVIKSVVPNILISKYGVISAVDTYRLVEGIAYDETNQYITVYDSNHNTTVEDFVSYVQGQILYYELAEPKYYCLDNLLGEDWEILNVEPNGTIEFHYPNKDLGYEIDTPSKITYMVNVSEVA